MERGSASRAAPIERRLCSVNAPSNVRYWYKADIGLRDCESNIPFTVKDRFCLALWLGCYIEPSEVKLSYWLTILASRRALLLQTDITILKRRKRNP